MSTVPFPTQELDILLDRTLEEDVGPGDVTTQATIPRDARARAAFLAKDRGIVAGLSVADRLLQRVDASLEVSFTVDDGDYVEVGQTFGTVQGPAAPLLTAERSMLNLMQRMSGIATATRRMVEAAKPHPAQILDTRKTVPGLRKLDKWAVRLGGGTNHRQGLYDMVLIKENHIDTAGGIRAAVEATHRFLEEHALERPIEVETRSLEEVRHAVDAGGVDRILLDNMVTVNPEGDVDTSMVDDALSIIGDRIPAEVSGNVTLDTIPAIAATGVAYISSGALTHSVRALDVSLLVDVTS